MIILLLYVASSLATSAANERPFYDIEQAESLFEDFIKTYGKSYSKTDKPERLLKFIENLKVINKKNLHDGAVFAINQFSDLSNDEFLRSHTGIPRGYISRRRDRSCDKVYDEDITTGDAPDAWDWSKEGAVTAVKDQIDCGSCWAFAAIGTIEGQYFLKNKKLLRFSEQALIDCSLDNFNCNGGLATNALLDLIDIGGVQTEDSYPYADGFQECKFNRSIAVEVKGCTHYMMRNEKKFKEVLFKTGPIAVAVNALDLMQYGGGIMHLPQCRADLDLIQHAVLMVGYGTDDGIDFWVLKNSWSTTWGEEGFFRVHRGDNTCGLMNDDANSSAEL